MQTTVRNSFDTLPDEMKQLKQWLLWKREVKTDKQGNIKRDNQGNIKYDKVPKQLNGYTASKTEPSHWVTYNEAIKAYDTGGFSGIGFVLVEKDPYVIVDLDDCFSNGELVGKAKTIVDSLNSYTEISQSGNGLHIVVKADNVNGFNNQSEGVEMYSQKWFFAVTGNTFNDDLLTIEDRDDIVKYLHDTYSARNKNQQSEPVEDQAEVLSDDELLARIENSGQKNKFTDLYYKGDISHYDSGSEADFALANILAWWTKNSLQIERIMRNSALYRNKWDKHPDYLQHRTIRGAMQNNEGKGYMTGEKFQLHVNSIDSKELKEILESRRHEELALMRQQHEKEGGKGRPPKTINPARCAIILLEYIPFCLFDLEENTKLAMYLPDEGIYTRNATRIKRVISWLEPKLNSRKADDVIYHLTNRATIKEKTDSRYLIPVNNGVFNLETKELEPFNPDYVFTAKISTNYVDNPENPVINGWNIEKWIDSLACGDEEIVNLLWQVVNDSLNGNYTRKKAIFLIGSGNNGKGTFQELITRLIGLNNVATLKVNEFDKPFRLSMLEGKTVTIGDDVPVNVYIDDSSNFNSVVTGDVVSVEQKNKPVYNTVYKCTVIQSTNDMPKFKNKENATSRRLIIVPFKADFNGKEENTKIKEEYIRDEKVLQYVLHKAINMDFEKFDIPQASMNELEIFKEDNDPVLEFKTSVFDEWILDRVPKYIVYEFYKMFCEENGYKNLSKRQFLKRFDNYVIEEWHKDKQARFDNDELIDYFGGHNILRAGEVVTGRNYTSYLRRSAHENL